MNIYEKGGCVRVDVYVQPRASRTELVGEHGDSLKLRVAAPPVDGEANAEVIRCLARLVGVAPSRVEVVAGEGSRRKVVAISGASLAAVTNSIAEALRKK